MRRIAQILLLNALKYTRSGPRRCTAGASVSGTRGPGFHAGPGAPIVNSLAPALAGESLPEAPDATTTAPGDDDARPISQSPGEGLGLAIVKRLCDLLDAMVEIETVMDKGTTVRVLLPRRYAAP